MDHDLKTESRNLTLGDASVVDARGGPGKTGLSAASRGWPRAFSVKSSTSTNIYVFMVYISETKRP